jgi:hypothetical protein
MFLQGPATIQGKIKFYKSVLDRGNQYKEHDIVFLNTDEGKIGRNFHSFSRGTTIHFFD